MSVHLLCMCYVCLSEYMYTCVYIHVIVCLLVCLSVCNVMHGYKPNIQFHTIVAGGDAEEKEASDAMVVFKGKAPVDTACKQKLTKVHLFALGIRV